MYRRENFANVPRARRRAALELQLPAWSPFRRTGHHCVWSGATAMVWFWDEDKIRAGRERFDSSPDGDRDRLGRRRIVPETLFRPRESDGVALRPCVEGFEMQRWQAGVLLDSFWFPQQPGEREQAWFLARHDDADPAAAPLTTAPSTPAAPATPAGGIVAEPWSAAPTLREWFEVNERAVVSWGLLALSLLVLWQEARYWKTRHLTTAATADFAALQDELAPLLAVRNELRELRQRNRLLADIVGDPTQTRLMVLVDRALPSPEAQFQEWHYQRGELTVVIEDADADPTAYVRTLEDVPQFHQVAPKPIRGEGLVAIDLKVRS